MTKTGSSASTAMEASGRFAERNWRVNFAAKTSSTAAMGVARDAIVALTGKRFIGTMSGIVGLGVGGGTIHSKTLWHCASNATERNTVSDQIKSHGESQDNQPLQEGCKS